MVRTHSPHRASGSWSTLWVLVALLGCQGTVDSEGVPPAEYTGDPAGPPNPGTNPGPGSGSEPGTPSPGPGSDPGTPATCASPSPGSAPLRRLSNAEYRNTLSDLFSGVDGVNADIDAAVRELPPEAESLGFRNSAEFLTVQSLVAQKYMDAADRLAARASKSAALVPCQPQAGSELQCGKQFVAAFGAKAHRHPLSPEQTARYEALFQKGLTDYGFETAVEWVVYAVLQSPDFLYRVEAGSPGGAAGVTQPTPSELAVRLSYLFWQSTPDQALLDAASTGGLDSKELVAAKAREMLADPRSARLYQYFAEWLDLDRLDEFSRDPKIFEDLPVELPNWFQSESRAFVSQLLSNGGDFHELLTAPYTFANRGLAEHYGLEPGAGEGFSRVSAPSRSGVLTQAFLSTHDKANRTSIVRRGLKVRTDLLCNNVPAPPNDVALDLEGLGEGLSQKQKLEQHRAEPTCAGCHQLMDPFGVVFENFDAVGRERTKDESGQEIVTATTLLATRDMDGPIANVRELGEKLAQSAEARDCYVTQTFRFFFGRDVEPADACTIQQLRKKFAENPNLSELLVELTQTDAFLYRPVIEVQP